MVQLSATTCSCIAILWVNLVSFAAITICVASDRVFIVVSVYFVVDSVWKLLDTPSYKLWTFIPLLLSPLSATVPLCSFVLAIKRPHSVYLVEKEIHLYGAAGVLVGTVLCILMLSFRTWSSLGLLRNVSTIETGTPLRIARNKLLRVNKQDVWSREVPSRHRSATNWVIVNGTAAHPQNRVHQKVNRQFVTL
jgi:hypothetical protein